MNEPTFFCGWPWRSLTLLADGRASCGCADPFGQRIVGQAGEAPEEIWNGPRLRELRRAARAGRPHELCRGCPLGGRLPPEHPERDRPETLERGPWQLYVEPSAACNLACRNDCCGGGGGVERYRERRFLAPEELVRMVAAFGPGLGRIEMYNYGESFLNPDTPNMIATARSCQPNVFISATTNGHPFVSGALRRAVLESGIDELMFSIDGARPESYAAYRTGGDLERVLAGLGSFLEERRQLGRGRPYTIWRYILFRWNDSDEELDEARRLAADLGVDRFCFEITTYPEGTPSERFARGTPGFERIRYEVWGEARYGFRAVTEVARLARVARCGRRLPVRVRLRNTGVHPWEPSTPYGQRWVSLGFALLDGHGRMLDRDYFRAALPRRVEPGSGIEIELRLPVPRSRGLYRLVIEPVYEGVGWFGELGKRGEVPVERTLVAI